MLAGLRRNLAAGLALFGLRRVRPQQFVISFEQLALLTGVDLLVWGILDTLHAESGTRLMLDGLYGWCFYLLIGLFGCGLVARVQSAAAATRTLLVPVLAVAGYVLLAFWLIADWREPGILLRGAAVLYCLALGVRVLQAAFAAATLRASVVLLLCILAAAWALHTAAIDTRLWLDADAGDGAQSADDGETEALLYEQPARIAAALGRIPPREAGHANVFFVGFAGDGAQAIFRREALFAASVLGEHFDATARALELINDEEDRDSWPIASVAGLRHALRLIASRMDVERDVLVLLLTSHGSQEGLAVANGALPLQQLGPADLAQALDESGIVARVVIVSACYAGVFVDALQNANTLVITAADAGHSSFGCDDDRELTYFGEALLRDSVPVTPTLEAAFRRAAALIDQREVREHKPHSHPQISSGERVRARLAEIEAAARPHSQSTMLTHR